jgi:hypothetical protein
VDERAVLHAGEAVPATRKRRRSSGRFDPVDSSPCPVDVPLAAPFTVLVELSSGEVGWGLAVRAHRR